MSTKASLAFGDSYHLYSECFSDKFIYLHLSRGSGFDFEATNDSLTVGIPLEVWEHIRQKTTADYSYADRTDEELLTEARQFVEERLMKCQNTGSERGKKLASFFGTAIYGLVDDPVEDQIARGVAELKARRARQRALREHVQQAVTRKQNLRAGMSPDARASASHLTDGPPPLSST